MKLTLTPSKKSNGTDVSLDNDFRIHEGTSYQANIPTLDCKSSSTDHDGTLLWKPTNSMKNEDLHDYIQYAKQMYRMNEEQALAILFLCKYNISTSEIYLEKYTPDNDEWTDEEKFLFEQAFEHYGKSFSSIRQMLPEKTIAELVRYYYTWKQTRKYQSLIDRNEKQYQSIVSDDENQQNVTFTSLPRKDFDQHFTNENDHNNNNDDDNAENQCCNCRIICQTIHSTSKGFLCNECYVYWQCSGLMKPQLYETKSINKKIEKPPKNLFIDINDFKSNDICDRINKLEIEIENELSTIQLHNQTIEYLTVQSRDGLENMQIPFLSTTEVTKTTTQTWSVEEIVLAIQAFAKYGKDFENISRIIGSTKTIDDIERFYYEYRDRYKLDMVIDMNSKSLSNVKKCHNSICFC